MSYVPSVIITCILVVRQQITRKFQGYIDWISLFNAFVAIVALMVFFIYQKRVIIHQKNNTAVKNVSISKNNIIDDVKLPSHTLSSTGHENEMVNFSVLVVDAPTATKQLSKSKEDATRINRSNNIDNDGGEIDDYDDFFYSEGGEIVELINDNKMISV